MEATQGRTLLLLSCSRDKRSGGELLDLRSRSVPACIPRDPSLRLLSTREKVRQMLQGNTTRLYNEDQKGGFRDERRANQRLIGGPDFSGPSTNRKTYLPAYRRYSGRFFARIEQEAPDFWQTIPGLPIEILFVSGLYGLLLWDEQIQNYDCHLADYTKERRSRTVAEIWKNTLTDALCAFLLQQNRQGGAGPIRFVYDLLSEETYQTVFDWKRVASSGVQVFHRVFMSCSGPDILPRIASIMTAQLQSFFQGPSQFQRQTLYPVPGETLPVHFAFEYPIGAIPHADREGESEDIRRQFSKELPHVEKTFPLSLQQLALAEHSFRKTSSVKQFDHGVLIVSFAKSVEHVLRTVCRSPVWADKRTFGQLVGELKDRRIWCHLWRQLDELHELRDSGAHSARVLTPSDLDRARQLALEILSQMRIHRSKS